MRDKSRINGSGERSAERPVRMPLCPEGQFGTGEKLGLEGLERKNVDSL